MASIGRARCNRTSSPCFCSSACDIESRLEGTTVCPGDLIAWEGPDTGKFRLRIGTTPDGSDVLNERASDLGFIVGELPADTDLHLSLRYQPADTTTWILQDHVAVVACPA